MAVDRQPIIEDDAAADADDDQQSSSTLASSQWGEKVFGVPVFKAGHIRGITISLHPFLLFLPVLMAVTHISDGAS